MNLLLFTLFSRANLVQCTPMRILLIVAALLVPLQASALEYRNLSLLYTDAPFIPSEAAGISLLTSLNAIGGYPDGTYRPNRTVNRAEFLKIVLASYPKVRVSKSDSANCFPDVSAADWFSQYVCLAKKRGMVAGYPDGRFKPERSVNYAEALKIMGELYNYVSYTEPDEEWYAGYVRSAQFHKTALPSSIKYDRPLTRGQMARLAAAFRANEEGELEVYRLAEKSLDLVVAREIAERVQEERIKEESEDVEDEQEPEEVIEQKPVVHTFPATHKFLMLGTREIIGSGFFQPRSESVLVSNVTVKFRSEIKNIRSLHLVDEYGTRIAELNPDTYDKNELTWKAARDDVDDYIIPVQGKMLGVEAVLTDQDSGFAEELVQLKWMSMNVSPMGQSETSYQLVASSPAYPSHQTSRARVDSIRNNKPPIVDLNGGQNILLAEFEIGGSHLDNAELQINHLTFTFAKKQGVSLSDFRLGAFHDTASVPCSLESGIYVNCMNIDNDIGKIEDGSVLFQLWGSLEIDESHSSPQLQIDLRHPGTLSTTIDPGTMGHVRWTDGTGAYNWVDFARPIAKGSLWK